MNLFPHNQKAYEEVIAMLSEKGRAAVIHPTGTGKSFIAFQLCAEHPAQKICWLSPSEYIFRTQLENWQAAGGEALPNISFFTYTKLMQMSEEKLAEITPDYIVLDEFHRCGAQMWQQGVEHLLELYPAAQMLGLSATNIRYLDHRRDMAEELFEGNVASEMSLGEAIVLGILHPPKYVLSVFSYQKDLEKYEKRVRRAKNKAVRDEAEKYLEALRRALEKSEGLEEIFERHMTEKHGKYLVFCASFEHMQEMTGQAKEWFEKIDYEPHIYTAYAEDPETSRAFAKFKEDESDHLKLLFCIDMLNEGIHVDDVSGVILLRPTVSPIVYKQQIGRALSAGGKKNAVIFDIVLNIESLYSIGAVEEEMQIASAYYRTHGRSGEIVHEKFHIIEEVRDCRELFARLEETLSASWELMYEMACAFYEEYGHLDVPAAYRTEEGYSLGRWIVQQKAVRSGQAEGKLTPTQIEKLDAIGMVWEKSDFHWERGFRAACAYARENGNLRVPVNYETPEGIRLGTWIQRQRLAYKQGKLSAERKEKLEAAGMVWSEKDRWTSCYQAVEAYYRKNGTLNIPQNYQTDGMWIGKWLVRQKQGYEKLSKEQQKLLSRLPMEQAGGENRAWYANYADAAEYAKTHGSLTDVPKMYAGRSGARLRDWMSRQRRKQRLGELSEEQVEKLEKIGVL